MTEANVEAREYWNGPGGERWAEKADAYERQLAAWVEPLLLAAGVAPGHRVVDIGCGAGPTTRAAGERVGPRGLAVGVDVSVPLLARARARTSAANVRFIEADAQTAPLSELCGGVVDRAISRFGVMFFDDPVAAFANVAASLAPDGRLAFITWRSAAENPWMSVPGRALADGCGVDFVTPGLGAGPFGMADAERVAALLEDAGYTSIEFEPLDLPMAIGGGLGAAEAAAFVFDAVTQFLPDGGAELTDRGRAMGWARAALEPHENERGQVVLPSASWIVTAEAAARPV